MNRRHLVTCAALAVAALIVTAIAWPQLPARVPIHWNAGGTVDGYGPRSMLLVIGPGAMAALTALFAALPWLSPKPFAIDSFAHAYGQLVVIVIAMFGYLYAVVLWAGFAGELDIRRALLGGISVMIVLVGNMMGKVRRNFFIGVRTPWSLANERVWYSTHRFAARAMVAAGLIGLAIALAGGPIWLWLAVLIGGTLSPVVFSLVDYKRLERSGQL